MPDPVQYAGIFGAVVDKTREAITGYGETHAIAAVGSGLRDWPDGDLEGTLMAGAWHVAGMEAPAYPPGADSRAAPEMSAAYASAITAADTALDSLIDAMRCRGTRARLDTTYEQACEEGRQWAAGLPAATRRDQLTGMLAAAARRTAIVGLGYNPSTGAVNWPPAQPGAPVTPPAPSRRPGPLAGELSRQSQAYGRRTG